MNTIRKSPPPTLPVLPLALATLGVSIVLSTGWDGFDILFRASLSFAVSSEVFTAGLWPTVVGMGLTLCGVWCAALEWRRRPPIHRPFRSILWGPEFIGISFACLLWVTLLPYAGWLCASVLALALACRSAQTAWRESLALIIVLVGGLYLGVEILLNSPLPAGLWTLSDFYTRPAAFFSSLPAPCFGLYAGGLYA